MVHVRRVWMGMLDRAVLVPMCVWFARRIPWVMNVPMVLIMGMRMSVQRELMDVRMLMMLGGVQPDT